MTFDESRTTFRVKFFTSFALADELLGMDLEYGVERCLLFVYIPGKHYLISSAVKLLGMH